MTEDPADWVCLCQLGLPLKSGTSNKPGTMMVYTKKTQSGADQFVSHLIANPIWNDINGYTKGQDIFEGGHSAGSSYSIYSARRLWTSGRPFYYCRSGHALPPRSGPQEIANIPSLCPVPGCEGVLTTLHSVTDKDPVTEDENSLETWDITRFE